MQQHESIPDTFAARILGGYFVSVSVATIVFVLIATLSRVSGFESAINNTFSEKATDLATMTALIFFASWIVAFTVTALPCVALSWIARKYRINCWLFYTLAGIALAMLVSLLNFQVFDHWYGDPQGDGLFNFARVLVPAGAISGLAFWRVAGRHYRHPERR
ncbi:hypothetical protein [Paraburkholderia megapolitana]|uniref:hypothetical protein n=1 Tax=Paraburkholderia megapolitana TaxID=420953 RepID=UPI0038BA0D8F